MIPDWNDLRTRVVEPGWEADVLKALRADFEHWRQHLHVPGPERPSAWGHHYFCDDDGEPLRFDPDDPHRHVCQSCGRTYAGEPWDGAWRSRMHSMAVAQTQRAVVLAQLETDRDRQTAAVGVLDEIVRRYARDYSSYELHGVNVGKGRVGSQNLDEAVWAIGLFRSVRWAGSLLPESTLAAARQLAAEVAGVLEPQLGMIHNIHCWLVAALAECAVATGDTELLTTVTDGPFGARKQIMEGFHSEGLWFEVNPHYHFYTVNALLSFVEAAGPDALAGEPGQRLRRAVEAPAELAYSDARIPAYGDGWADSFLGTFAQTVEVASALLPGVDWAVVARYLDDRPSRAQVWLGANNVDRSAPATIGRNSVGALVFGVPVLPTPDAVEQSTSFAWEGPGIGLLRGPGVRVAMRFGPDAGWHDHHDKLAVDVECGQWRSLDLGTSGYGADITVWMRSQAAHNLLIVDARPQPKHSGELIHADDRSLVAQSSWNDAQVRRSVHLTTTGWTDEMDVTCDPGTRLEWLFHGDGTILGDFGATLELPGDDLGHSWLTEVHSLTVADGTVNLTWDHPDAPNLRMTLPAGWEAFCASAPANPNGLPLGVIAVRGVAAAARTTLRAEFGRGHVK